MSSRDHAPLTSRGDECRSAPSQPRERPILFSAPMVRAILDGRKTQTRRVVKTLGADTFDGIHNANMGGPGGGKWWDGWWNGSQKCNRFRCPYGVPGDLLWVRESFRIGEDLGEGWEPWMSQGDRFISYACPEGPRQEAYDVPGGYEVPRNAKEQHHHQGTPEHWREFGTIPGRSMPRWASRITLRITGVRVERLNDIDEDDALAEGCEPGMIDGGFGPVPFGPDGWTISSPGTWASARGRFQMLWGDIHGDDAWDANPWVWAVSFERMGTTAVAPATQSAGQLRDEP